MSFHIEGRARTQQDPIRTFMWQLWIPDLPNILKIFKKANMDDLIFACKTAILPGMLIENIETYFLGRKQIFPSRVAFDNTFDVTFEDTEEQKILKILYEWMQKIQSTDPKNIFYSNSSYLTKGNIAKDVWLKLYKYNTDELKYNILFHNAFPSSITPVTLDYTGNETVKYNVTFSYDYWTLEN